MFESRPKTLYLRPQAMNLREITKKVGRNIGLNLPAVQLFAKQLLLALHHFRDCGVLHADIKPDNILINERHNAVKVRRAFAVWQSCLTHFGPSGVGRTLAFVYLQTSLFNQH